MGPSDSTTGTLASRLRTRMSGLLDKYEGAAGLGPDPYDGTVRYHPMADGKYLSAIAVLNATGLLSATIARGKADAAAGRLVRDLQFHERPDSLWGLGFAWNGTSGREVFLITSSMVTRGLVDASRQCPSDLLADLASRAAASLGDYVENVRCAHPQGGDFPAYSPTIRRPIYNATIHALATLESARVAGAIEALPSKFSDDLDRVRNSYVPCFGWPYEPRQDIFDLLHTCYVAMSLSRLLGAPAVEEATFAATAIYMNGPRLFDRFKLMNSPIARSLRNRNVEYSLFATPHATGVLFHEPARAWSFGEFLTLLATMAREGTWTDYWLYQLRRIADAAIDGSALSMRYGSDHFPRHDMHLAHGLASALAALRSAQG